MNVLHSKIVKLNRHAGFPAFDLVMLQISAMCEEANFDVGVEIDRLLPDMKSDLIDALESLEYQVTYTPGDETLYLSLP